MKINQKKYLLIITIGIIVATLFYVLPPIYHSFREFTDPDWNIKLANEWDKKPSSFLIKQLKSDYYLYFGTAAGILSKRKEEKAVKVLTEVLNNKKKDSQIKIWAAYGLAEIGNEEAIEILMQIVKSGRNHPDYINALRALSSIKYEPAFKFALEIATIKDDDRSYAVSMLERYGKPEAIPALQIIANEDSERYIREKAKRAIEQIQSKGGVK